MACDVPRIETYGYITRRVHREEDVPLSEEEQRLLQQMEQALAAEDPSLASTLRGSKMRARNRRQAIASVLGFILGIGILMVGVQIGRASCRDRALSSARSGTGGWI